MKSDIQYNKVKYIEQCYNYNESYIVFDNGVSCNVSRTNDTAEFDYSTCLRCRSKNDANQVISIEILPFYVTNKKVYYSVSLEIFTKKKEYNNADLVYNVQTGKSFSLKEIKTLFNFLIDYLKECKPLGGKDYAICIYATNKRRFNIYEWFLKKNNYKYAKTRVFKKECLMFNL